MLKSKKESFFWTSYSDLMTSLFFVMLLLFILVIVLLQKRNMEQAGTIEQQKRLLKIDEQFNPLIESGKFQYYPISKKFIAKSLLGQEIFEPNQTKIKPEFRNTTIDVGREIRNFLQKLSQENKDFSYLLIIEGNMANTWDQRINQDQGIGYRTSYERALAVYQLWVENDINLRAYNAEILICGSGYNGLDRDSTEENNKRFSIQIIPKISSPKDQETKK